MTKKKKKKTVPRLTFGKYSGEPLHQIIEKDPEYILWVHNNVKFFPLRPKELNHLNYVWKRKHSTYAVLTLKEAENIIHNEKPLGKYRTRELYKISNSVPALKEAAMMIIEERQHVRRLKEIYYGSLRKPVFQTDDI